MQKGPRRDSKKTVQRIHKLCKSVELYVVRIRGKSMKSPVMTQSKPCERCAQQLRLLGFRKIHYINDDRKADRLDLSSCGEECTSLSWGLKNVRSKTTQVARTFSQTRCLSYTSSSDESDSDDSVSVSSDDSS